MQPELAREAYFIHWKHLLRKIEEHPRIQVFLQTQVEEILSTGVRVSDAAGRTQNLLADTILIATGMRSNNEMLGEWEKLVPELRVVGDCSHSARIMEAMRSGYCAGYTI